jgi:hypothetical protein
MHGKPAICLGATVMRGGRGIGIGIGSSFGEMGRSSSLAFTRDKATPLQQQQGSAVGEDHHGFGVAVAGGGAVAWTAPNGAWKTLFSWLSP